MSRRHGSEFAAFLQRSVFVEISAGPYSRVVMFGCVDMIAFGGLLL